MITTKRYFLLCGVILICVCFVVWQSFYGNKDVAGDRRGWHNSGGNIQHHVPRHLSRQATEQPDTDSTHLDNSDGLYQGIGRACRSHLFV